MFNEVLFDPQVIISGSSDATVRVWDVNTGKTKNSEEAEKQTYDNAQKQISSKWMFFPFVGEMVNTLIHHTEAVLHLRFYNGMMVTCSKDR